jgi:hypothetical protein
VCQTDPSSGASATWKNTPLLPFFAMRQSNFRSKLSNVSTVMMSPPLPVRTRAPSTTDHPSGICCDL